MARRYPAHMAQMKSRYGKTITGMAETHPSPMYSRSTEGPYEGLAPSYTGGLFDAAVGSYGATQISATPVFGLGNGGIGYGNSTGQSPTPSVNPWYSGSARVFGTGSVGPDRTPAAPGRGDKRVGEREDPGMEMTLAREREEAQQQRRKARPIVLLGAAAAAAAVLYGLTR